MSNNPAIAGLPQLVTQIVSGYLKKNYVPPADLPGVISTVYQSLIALDKPPEPPPKDPAVPIRQSVRPNYVVCLECGWRGNMLRRHLQARHDLTREQYRARWRLPSDHALTAPAYAQRRSDLAKQLGLGKGTRPRPRRSSS